MKRIQLPSGKIIEIVSLEDIIGERLSSVPNQPVERAPAEGMHVCPECNSKLVYPTDWEEADYDHWQVDLHCPNCDWTDRGKFHQDLLDDYDEELDRGFHELGQDLGRLSRANMAEWTDSFLTALKADAIQPIDF